MTNLNRLRDNLLKYTNGMTQRQIAFKLDLSDTVVNKWFAGIRPPSLSAAYRLCKMIGITVEQLMEGVEE